MADDRLEQQDPFVKMRFSFSKKANFANVNQAEKLQNWEGRIFRGTAQLAPSIPAQSSQAQVSPLRLGKSKTA